MDTVWNFAFGSNLLPQKVRARGIEALHSHPAILHGWELSFDLVGTPPHEPGYATLRRAPKTTCVHGVLLEMSAEHFQRLLRSELASQTEDGPGYHLQLVTPTTYDGQSIDAQTLVAYPDDLIPGMIPSRRYLSLLQRGAKALDLDPDYQDFLHHLPHMQPTLLQPLLKYSVMLAITPALLPAMIAWSLGKPTPLAKLLHFLGPRLARHTAHLPEILRGKPQHIDDHDWHTIAQRWPQFRTHTAPTWPTNARKHRGGATM